MRLNVRTLIIVLLLAAWLVPGLVGRDPWMNDEPYTFGVANHIAKTGEWVVPMLGGDPFLEKPPLYFLTAAACIRLFSPPLEPHDAARLASGFYLLLVLLFTGLAARELLGEKQAETAVLLLLGSSEILLAAHKMITDMALLAGFAVAFYGLASSVRRPVSGGLWTGTGVGIGFLSKGLFAPGIFGVTAVLLPLLFSAWRKRTYVFSLLVALIAVLPWLLIWPYALYLRSPELFNEWFWFQNFGRFLGFWVEGPHSAMPLFTVSLGHGLRHLSLERLAVPILPFAIWSLWQGRRSLRDRAGLQVPLTLAGVILLVLGVSANVRPLYALPLLLPLSVLAAEAVDSLPERAARVIARSVSALFGLGALLLWALWFFSAAWPLPAAVEALRSLGSDQAFSFSGGWFAAGLACTLVFLLTTASRTAFRSPVAASWTTGITLVWGLVMTLWLPALDARESYRHTFESLREASPGLSRCIASRGLDENDRAMLEYYAGVVTQRVELNEIGECDRLLVASGNMHTVPVSESWQLVWKESKRRGNSREIFSFYQSRPLLRSALTERGPGREFRETR